GSQSSSDLSPRDRTAIGGNALPFRGEEVGRRLGPAPQDLDDDVRVQEDAGYALARWRRVSRRRRLTYSLLLPMSFRSRHRPSIAWSVEILWSVSGVP